jgi:acyl carrier protein
VIIVVYSANSFLDQQALTQVKAPGNENGKERRFCMAQLTQDEVFAKVRKVVAEVFKVEESQISLQTKFMDDLKAESLDIITLLMEFEEAFDRTIPDEDAEKLLSVQDAVNYVMALEEKAPQA